MEYLPFPELESNRLYLRQLSDLDDIRIFQLRSDDRINAYLDREKPVDINEAREFINKIKIANMSGNSLYWVICLKQDPKLIGTICLWNFSQEKMIAEVGYEMLTEYQGLGYVDEALKVVMFYGFNTLGLQAIEAITHKDNSKSNRLLERNHFVKNFKVFPENDSVIMYNLSQAQYNNTT